MIITKMRYDADGDLLAPRERDLDMKAVLLNQPVTVDPGHWHRIKIAAATKDQLMVKLATIAGQLRAIPGVAVWREQLSTMDRVDGRQQVVADLVYCVPAR